MDGKSIRINLNSLVNIKAQYLPRELDKLNLIYKITNVINSNSYIGKTTSFKSRFYGGHLNSIRNLNSEYSCQRNYLLNAFRKYGIENFEVSILEYDIEPKDLNNREIYWISYYNTFLGKGYNMTKGGDGGSWVWARYALKLKYPETNGIAPWIRAINLLNYPNSNGVSPNFWVAGHKSLKIKYSGTNGMPTEAREANLRYYPDTNGASPVWISAGRDSLKLIYPDTNGMPPKSYETHRLNCIYRSYGALNEMCIKAELDGIMEFTSGRQYKVYKIDFSPQYKKAEIQRVFNNCREFGLDINLISKFIRKDWQ